MTNERNDVDPLVSDVYRELADETTPEALNREVLRLAAKQGRTPYSLARAWMRPAAWAATIGLSLVVVLQLTNLPVSDTAPVPKSVPATAPAADTAEERRDLRVEEPAFELKAREEQQDAAALAKRSRPYSPEEQTAEKVMVLSDAPTASADLADDEGSGDAGESGRAIAPARRVVEEVTTRTRVAQDATGHAAERSADDVLAVESFAAGIAVERAEDEYLCPVKMRISADKWFECIVEQEETSNRELVDREYREFRKRYPEFEHPATDR